MSESVRIGLDARYAFRTNRRGIGEYISRLLLHLPQLADPSDRFCVYVDGPADPEAIALADPRFTVKRLERSNPVLWEEFDLPRAARRDRLDLLHLTSNYGPSLAPCCTVHTIHDTIDFVRPTFGRHRLPLRQALARSVRTRTLPIQARRARLILTESEASKRDIAHWLQVSPERVHVVPLGVSDEFRPPSDWADVRRILHQANFDPTIPYVLALGALDPRKNGDAVIRAFQSVPELTSGCELRLVGIERTEDYAPSVRPRPPWLRINGYVSRTTLIALMQGALAFVYPSLYEGFGLPTIEAMACGVPVIASAHPAIVEAVADCALTFTPTDVDQLAGLLTRIARDDVLRGRLADAGVARAQRFTWLNTARQTYAAYRHALSLAGGCAA